MQLDVEDVPILLVFLELGGVAGAPDPGNQGRVLPLGVDGRPVGGGEELACLDVVHTVLQVAVPLGQVDLERFNVS